MYRLHKEYGIFNVRINENTIWFPDDGYEMDEALVGGLSSPTTTPRDASEDCLQIFQTVRHFVDRDMPYSWLGNEILDDLYRRIVSRHIDSWPYNVVSLCHLLQVDANESSSFWSTIEVQKDFYIRFETTHESSKLNLQDIKDYLYADAFLHSKKSSSSQYELFQEVITAISRTDHDDKWISVAGYHIFQSHMQKRHASNVGRGLMWQLPGSRIDLDITSPIRETLRFQVPYHIGHGLISISYLRKLAPLSFDPTVLEAFLTYCYEVRGPIGLAGVYIATKNLEKLAQLFNLRFDASQLRKPGTSLPRGFTHERRYLLAVHESAKLFPVDRNTGIVSKDDTQQSLAQFLSEHFDKDAQIDIATEHDPASLLTRVVEPQPDPSSDGSIKPSTSSLHFEFGRRQYGNEDDTLGRTRSWVKQEREAKRRRGNRGDIQPTVFAQQPSNTCIQPSERSRNLQSTASTSSSSSSNPSEISTVPVSLYDDSNP
jgi:hypothetical protein